MSDSGVVEIDPRGDVVLICGTADQSRKIQVSSKVLTLSSSVFDAMLDPNSPHFQEGHILATNSSLELPLPEDDPDAMTVICEAIHMRNKSVPQDPSADEILKIAKLVDKFHFGEAIAPTAECWITKHLATCDNETRYNLLAASYLCEHAELFCKIGHDVIMHSDPDVAVACEGYPDAMSKIIAALHDQISAKVRWITDWVAEYLNDQTRVREGWNAGCGGDCTYQEIRAAHLMRIVNVAALWPAASIGAGALGQKLDAMRRLSVEFPNMLVACQASLNGNCAGDFADSPGEICRKFREEADVIYADIRPLCLLCAKEGNYLSAECEHAEAA